MLSSIQKHLLSILRYIFNDVLKSVCLYSKYSILFKKKKKQPIAVLSLVFGLSSQQKYYFRLPWSLVSYIAFTRQYTSHVPS